MSVPPLWIVKTGSAEPAVARLRGDFEVWIGDGVGYATSDVRVADVCGGGELPLPAEVGAVVITGSAAFVSDAEPWSERTAAWLAPVVDAGTPVLGICYGHQLLARAFGGRVGKNPNGREIGTVEVDLGLAIEVGDALLGHLPGRVDVQATHVESVLELPAGAVRLASNEAEPNHAFRLGERAWGVQFHPEFDADVMRGYLEQRAEVVRSEGLDPEALIEKARDAPHGASVLARFGEIVRGC